MSSVCRHGNMLSMILKILQLLGQILIYHVHCCCCGEWTSGRRRFGVWVGYWIGIGFGREQRNREKIVDNGLIWSIKGGV